MKKQKHEHIDKQKQHPEPQTKVEGTVAAEPSVQDIDLHVKL